MKLKLFLVAIVSFVVAVLLTAQQTIDNAAVIEMTKKNVPEPIIIKAIASLPTQFQLGPEQLVQLTNAHVSQHVIEAMINRSAGNPPVPVPPIPVDSTVAPSTSGSVKISGGLEVQLTTVTTLTSETSKENDPIEFAVAEDVRVGDQVVLPKGSKAVGYVGQVARKGKFHAPGSLIIFAKYVETPDGKKIGLTGSKGSQVGAPSVGGAVAGNFDPFLKGKEAKMPKGTTILAHTIDSPQ